MSGPADPVEVAGCAAVIASAIEVGLIDSLSDPAAPAEHARRLRLDPEATRLELDALVAHGVAERRNGRFGIAGAVVDVSAGPSPSVVPERDLWAHLPRFLRTGKRYARMDGSAAERSAAYKELTTALGRLFADAARELAGRLPRRERILDVGAGSGVRSLAMAERWHATEVTAIDLPEVLPAFAERARTLEVSGRAELVAADYHSISLPSAAFDRMVLANVLHLEPPPAARSLVRRVTAGARPADAVTSRDVTARPAPEIRDRRGERHQRAVTADAARTPPGRGSAKSRSTSAARRSSTARWLM